MLVCLFVSLFGLNLLNFFYFFFLWVLFIYFLCVYDLFTFFTLLDRICLQESNSFIAKWFVRWFVCYFIYFFALYSDLINNNNEIVRKKKLYKGFSLWRLGKNSLVISSSTLLFLDLYSCICFFFFFFFFLFNFH